MYDVLIVGGGPAGLSAALILARACRKVLVIDAGEPRNKASPSMHGFLSRDGIPPLEFLTICRGQLARYPDVTFRHDEVLECVSKEGGGFQVVTAAGFSAQARLVLLAVGVRDELPALEGIRQFYGHSVHHCPHCDGWEHRGKGIIAYGDGEESAELAVELTGWSGNVTLCTGGRAPLAEHLHAKLSAFGVAVNEEEVAGLEGVGNRLQNIRMASGKAIPCEALFFYSKQRPSTEAMTPLGCRPDEEGCIPVNDKMETDRPGIYVAGNLAPGFNMAIMAAAEGAKAAYMMNEHLITLSEKEVTQERKAAG